MTMAKLTQNPDTPPLSAMTAAISMGRFLARNPEFAQSPALRWDPRPDGSVVVWIPIRYPEAMQLLADLSLALVMVADSTPFLWPATKERLVSVTLRGRYDGARWLIHGTVTEEAFDAFAAPAVLVGA